MNKKFRIRLIEENLNDDLVTVETRQWESSCIINMGEIKEVNIQAIKNTCKELVRFYDEKENIDNFVPYNKPTMSDKDKRIAELEEENKQRAYVITTYRKDIDNCIETIEELKKENEELKSKLDQVQGQYAYECGCNAQLVELQEENAKLQEQLKNGFVPKFKVRQDVWFILKDNKGSNIFGGTVYLITLNGYYQPSKFIYTILQLDDELHLKEEDLFATEADAQKYLEERK